MPKPRTDEPLPLDDPSGLVGLRPQPCQLAGIDRAHAVAEAFASGSWAWRREVRVAVTHCTMPPLSRCWLTSVKPASARMPAKAAERRQVRDRPGQVPVGGAVGEQGTEARHDMGEPDPVAEAHDPVPRFADFEQCQPASRLQHPAELVHDPCQIGEVAHREPAHDRVGGPVRTGSRAASA